MYQSTVMCETSQQKDLKQTEYPKSTSYAEDFPVKMLAQQVKELVSLIAQGTLPAPVFGESMPGLFANLSQDGSWQKTCAGYSQSLLPGFGGGGFGTVLRDLAEMGYRVGWSCYGAADVGAPHKRERVFIVAYRECMW